MCVYIYMYIYIYISSVVVSIETMVSLPGIIANPMIEFLLTTFEAKYMELLGASNKWEAQLQLLYRVSKSVKLFLLHPLGFHKS